MSIPDPPQNGSPARSLPAWCLPVLLGALAFVLSLWLNADMGRRPLTGDELDYHRIAVHLAANGRFGTAYRFPVYPLVVAGFYRLFGTSPGVMRIPNAILAGLTVFLTYLLARAGGMSKYRAALPPLLLAADAHIFLFAGTLLTENVFTPLVLGAALVLVRSADGRKAVARAWAIAGGAVLGISVLTRGQGAFFFIACLGYGAWHYRRTRHRPGLPSWGYSALATVVVGLVVWNAFIYRELGHWPGFTTGTGGVLYGSHCPEAYVNARLMGRWRDPDTQRGSVGRADTRDEWDRNRVLVRAAGQSILSHSLEENMRLLANKLFSAVYPSPGVPSEAPLRLKVPAILLAWGIVIGFVLALCRCPRTLTREHLPFYLGALAVILLFYGSKRLIFPVFPLICIDSVRAWQRVFFSVFPPAENRDRAS